MRNWLSQGTLPLRSPHVGAMHVVLVHSVEEHIAFDLLEVTESARAYY